ncbi:MAG: glutamine synthetase [Nocardioidaceae bacterium]|jgi:glutamine synthetase|nr:glutamine synthetase [Nocardioidaceae bacterium]
MTTIPEDQKDWLRERAEADGVQFFMAMFVDMHGKPCAKLVPTASLDMLLSSGAGFAGFAVGDMGQTPADPDLMAIPDPQSYMRLPWRRDVAVLHCDPHVEGEPWPYAPRVILRNLLDRAREDHGWVFKTGVEAEYNLLRRDEQGHIHIADPLDNSAKPCYEAKGLSRMWDHLIRVSQYVNELGWGNYANDHEDALGQFEQNWEYDEALVTADRTIFFRYMIHMLAHEAGMTATFMPKPFSHLTGNGLHTHMSLWSTDDRPLFEGDDDPHGLGLSTLGRQFLAGQLEHGLAMSSLVLPSVNSYKRIGVGAPNSGATWAPGYITYGGNNRTVMLRVPEGGQIEHRGVCGSANPYLSTAAILAAGMDGIERGLDPGAPVETNLFALDAGAIKEMGIQQFPATLADAVAQLGGDDVLRAAFGKVRDGDYVDYYARVKAAEFAEYHSVVAQWEIDRYLTLF